MVSQCNSSDSGVHSLTVPTFACRLPHSWRRSEPYDISFYSDSDPGLKLRQSHRNFSTSAVHKLTEPLLDFNRNGRSNKGSAVENDTFSAEPAFRVIDPYIFDSAAFQTTLLI
jgi:hypothetical protein